MDSRQIIDDLREPTRSLRRLQPAVWTGFDDLHRHAVDEGALSALIKELMCLAIAVVQHCDGCIAYHAKAAARHGATIEQIAEAARDPDADQIVAELVRGRAGRRRGREGGARVKAACATRCARGLRLARRPCRQVRNVPRRCGAPLPARHRAGS